MAKNPQCVYCGVSYSHSLDCKRNLLAQMLDVIRIKATRRFQASDYIYESSPCYGPMSDLAVDATQQLREMMELTERAQECLGK